MGLILWVNELHPGLTALPTFKILASSCFITAREEERPTFLSFVENWGSRVVNAGLSRVSELPPTAFIDALWHDGRQ